MKIEILSSGSSGNCYIISDGSQSLLLDAGLPIKEIRRGTGFNLSGIDGAVISHRHLDHAKAVPDLTAAAVNVYASSDVFSHLGVKGHRCKELRDKKTADINGWKVYPFEVHHDVPNFGFLIFSPVSKEKLLYVTDTYYISEKFRGLNYIMVEANYSPDIVDGNIAKGELHASFKKRLVKSHMSIDTLSDMLGANELSHVKRIYLLHLSDRNSAAIDFKTRIMRETGIEVVVA